jgi:MFS family permease
MESEGGTPRLGVLLAMAMFVFVIDTSFMNVSISAVVEDLDTTVSGVQTAIAVEALVSAAFILIGSKLGDLIGRKRAYVIGLAAYSLGAITMVFTESLAPVIIFWSVLGGLGASLYLPAMQALVHGNFEGKTQAKVYALVGASGAIAAAIGPVLGGFLTTLLSWRVGFLLEAAVIAIVLSGSGLIRDTPFTGDRQVDYVGSALSVVAMAFLVLGVLVWQEGGDSVALLLVIGGLAAFALARWLVKREREGKPALLDPHLFRSKGYSLGVSGITSQQIALGGMLIALPIFLQLDLGYNALEAGLSLAPLSLTTFAIATIASRRAGRRQPSLLIKVGFVLTAIGVASMIPLVPRADSGWWLVVPLIITGVGLGLLVSQLNNYTLSPISEERVSEAAGVSSAMSSFGLSVGLAFAGAILLAALSISFTNKSDASEVLPADEKERVAQVLEDDAQVMSDTSLEEQLAGQPEDIRAEVLEINEEARPQALQVALLVPLIATLIGMFLAFRMPPAPVREAAPV